MPGLSVDERAKRAAENTRAIEWSRKLAGELPIREACSILGSAQADLEYRGFVASVGAKPLREAWVGVRYGAVTDAIALSVDDAPDLRIVYPTHSEWWEVTEALDLEERLALASANFQLGIREDDWRGRASRFKQSLSRTIQAKTNKRYGREVGLLIYANLGLYGWFRTQFEAELHQITEPVSNHFAQINMLWEGRHYPLWADGSALPLTSADYTKHFD